MPSIFCMNEISRKGTEHLPDSFSLVENVSDADGILVRSAKFDGIEFPESLCVIARSGSDMTNIPIDECSERGIVVLNTPGANANSMKEAVLCAILLGSRNFVSGMKWIRDNAENVDIARAADENEALFAGHEIAGKTLGVIGLSATGRRVANAAVELGMEVLGFDPRENSGKTWGVNSRVKRVGYLDDICANCDYITIHMPAAHNEGLIGAREIGLMKPRAALINFAHDSLVDADAVAKALDNNQIRVYLTDFANEKVLAAKNAVVMPHIGSATAEAKENSAIMAVEAIVDYIENGNITNSVNYPACDLGPAPLEGSRIAVLHRNVPGVINTIASSIGEEGINLANIASRARGDYAYALVDVDAPLTQKAIDKMQQDKNILRVRVVK